MKEQTPGFIFITTLITITVISLLVMTCMQHVLLYHNAMKAIKKQHRNFYQLETLAMQLVNAKGAAAHCVDLSHDANGIISKLLHNQGCSLEFKSLRLLYLIEDLGDFPCLVIDQGNKKFSTHHQRVSLLLVSENSPNSLIQLRTISAIKSLPCERVEHKVNLGVSSWRYIAAC